MKNQIINRKYEPCGLADIEDIKIDLLRMQINRDSPFSLRVQRLLIQKIDIVIQKLIAKPRLPVLQIEDDIIQLHKENKDLHGVILKILFENEYGKIEESKLKVLNVSS